MTLLNHLESLPEPYRTKALNNARNFEGWENRKDRHEVTRFAALASAFIWHHSPEGFNYWWRVMNLR